MKKGAVVNIVQLSYKAKSRTLSGKLERGGWITIKHASSRYARHVDPEDVEMVQVNIIY